MKDQPIIGSAIAATMVYMLAGKSKNASMYAIAAGVAAFLYINSISFSFRESSQ